MLAVDAAVDLLLTVGELELMNDLLLDGGDAAGVFTLDHIGQTLWQC